MRRRLADGIATAVPEPQASLAQAMLLGMRRGVPRDIADAFRDAGAAHLLAVSGLHVGILMTASLYASAAVFGKRRGLYLIAPLLVIWIYGALSGMSPSAARACAMGSVYLAALASGRQRGGLTPLAIAAAAMVTITPSVINSISFQLSFAAIAGITALGQPIGDLMRAGVSRLIGGANPLRAPIALTSDMLAISIAATAATLPLIAYHFERVSMVTIPTTLLTLPAAPFVIIGGAMAGLLGMMHETLALPFGWLAWAAGGYTIGVVKMLSQLPNAAVNPGEFKLPLICAYYAALLTPSFLASLRPRKSNQMLQRFLRFLLRREDFRINPPDVDAHRSVRASVAIYLIIPAAFAAALIWAGALTGPLSRLNPFIPNDRLSVVFVDVGQGDAALITAPGGARMLIDGGGEPQAIAEFLGARLPFNDRRIDIVAATHPHSDHIGGLPNVLRRYDAKATLEPPSDHISAASPIYAAWRRAVADEGIDDDHILEARAGQRIKITRQSIMLEGENTPATHDDVAIEVLWPPETPPPGIALDANSSSLALRVAYRGVSVLMTGDIEAEVERALLAMGANLDADILKVAHHGSATSSTPEFIAAASPTIAVISAGADNRFGHPDPAVVARLTAALPDGALFATAQHGNVEILTDGSRLQVRTER